MTPRRALLLAPFAAYAAPNPLIIYKGYPKPFLYPILAPDGKVLSRGWPIDPRPGDNQDHTWHRGIWWGHDFWREQKGTASIRVDKVTNSNQLHQTLITASGESLAKLITRYKFHTDADAYRIDASLTLRSDQALRLREEFREDCGATLLNSEGQTGAKQIWGKPASWTDYSTTIDNKQYGVAILNSANPFAAYGSDGMVEIGRWSGKWGYKVYDAKGKLTQTDQSGNDETHAQNFIDCIRSRKKLNATIKTGHTSTLHAHLGNIVARTGRNLIFNPKTETIASDAEATQLLTRPYRKHWATPKNA